MTQGKLHIVATPIGHLGDITHRALEVLGSVDRVLAEDTRNTRRLLDHFSLKANCLPLHDHNERARVDQIAAWLDEGQQLALVSDAGTPLISDPGYVLVTELKKRGYLVLPVPGASAVVTALSVAGLPTDRFCFEGFLPAKSTARKTRLAALAKDTHTLVFYEAPHRIVACLEDMAEEFGSDRKACLCREMTKTFETYQADSLSGLVEFVSNDSNQQKGEIVVVVHGYQPQKIDEQVMPEETALMKLLLVELPPKKAASVAAEYFGKPKKFYYQLGLTLKAE